MEDPKIDSYLPFSSKVIRLHYEIDPFILFAMTKRKIKQHKGLQISKEELKKIAEKTKKDAEKIKLIKSEGSFPLTEVDRLTRVFKLNNLNEIVEITCISLEIKIKDEWITIVYYDSFHEAKLHKHVTISLEDKSDSPTTENVKKNGTQKDLLTWAIKDIIRNYFHYKREFSKRSKIKFKDMIDMQYK